MDVGIGVAVDVTVGVLVAVQVGVIVLVGVNVVVGVLVEVGCGASPETLKRPDDFHSIPTNIWTSYSPGSHASEEGSQVEYAYPPVLPSQGEVS